MIHLFPSIRFTCITLPLFWTAILHHNEPASIPNSPPPPLIHLFLLREKQPPPIHFLIYSTPYTASLKPSSHPLQKSPQLKFPHPPNCTIHLRVDLPRQIQALSRRSRSELPPQKNSPTHTYTHSPSIMIDRSPRRSSSSSSSIGCRARDTQHRNDDTPALYYSL